MDSSRSRTAIATSIEFGSSSKSCDSKVLRTDLRAGVDPSFLVHVVQTFELSKKNLNCRLNLHRLQVFLLAQFSHSPLFNGVCL